MPSLNQKSEKVNGSCDMRNLMFDMGLRPPSGALKSSDMRKSKQDKGMTLCRYFGGKCICVRAASRHRSRLDR